MAAPVVGTAAEHGQSTPRAACAASRSPRSGVAYGDIGTSPLYTMREAFGHAGGLHLSEAAVLGVLSLVFWSLVLIVSVKYVLLILRADNRGEGGVLALGTLAARAVGDRSHRLQGLILVLSLGGLALFYGDGLITPAISVLAAVEGLETAAPGARALRRAARRARAARPVRPPEPRHGQRGPAVRAGDAGLVRHLGPARAGPDRPKPGRARGARPELRRGPVRARRLAGVRRPGRDRAGGHRGGGALRRHGPLRPRADPPRLVRPRPARRWSSTTSARARCSCASPRPSSTRSTTWPRAGRCCR